MDAMIIDGKAIAQQVLDSVTEGIAERTRRNLPAPGLATILVGDNPGSQIYVRNKIKVCNEIGIRSIAHFLPSETSQESLEALISDLNSDSSVNGILVQLPLPSHIDEGSILLKIDPLKDVDGFHPVNAGLLSRKFNTPWFIPCTAAGVLHLIKTVTSDISGKRAVVIGRSSIVGMPTALLLSRENATVTICHSFTESLGDICKEADILVSAVGHSGLVQGDWIKEGAIVIDVGISRIPDPEKKSGTQISGDVVFQDAIKRARAITPVPRGVGPMTIAMLMKNTLIAAGYNS